MVWIPWQSLIIWVVSERSWKCNWISFEHIWEQDNNNHCYLQTIAAMNFRFLISWSRLIRDTEKNWFFFCSHIPFSNPLWIYTDFKKNLKFLVSKPIKNNFFLSRIPDPAIRFFWGSHVPQPKFWHFIIKINYQLQNEIFYIRRLRKIK